MTDLHELCEDLAGLRAELAGVIVPAAEPDRSLAGGSRWCAAHGHAPPYGPLTRTCRPGMHPHAAGLVAVALTGTGRGDGTSRRAIPGWRAPLTGDAVQCLAAQEGLDRTVLGLANTARRELGDVTRHRRAGPALDALPELLDRLPDGHALRRRAAAALDAHRGRARDVLGHSQRVLWLGDCPTTYGIDPYPVLTRDGLVTEVGALGCWTLDRAAMVDAGGGDEIWRRSRRGLLRDEEHAPVRCWGCGTAWDPASVEIADLVMAHLRAQVATTGGGG